MIARVSLEIALRREFDYAIPPELAAKVDVGSRVQVPFGPRKVLGVVTAVAEESAHANLKSIIKVIGAQTLVTPKVLKLARWIAEYYCCAPEIALKSVLPEAVRKEDAAWQERLYVRVLPQRAAGILPADQTKISKRQQEILNIVEEHREILLSELVQLAGTTAATVRKLEDKGMVSITSEISERDPYGKETILATQPLTLNSSQAAALEKIKAAMDAQQRAAGVPPAEPFSPFFKPEADVQKYSGWLPHWRQSDKMYFVTFRLNDSVAQDQLRAWAAQKEIWESHHPKPWDEKTFAEYHDRFTKQMERWLDNGYGSCALRRPEIGKLVENALRHFDGDRYQLGEYVAMPNHVHVLVRPAAEHTLESILHSWKSFTAKQANEILKTSGVFWREESFDHLVRSAAQYEKYAAYIRENPAKAGLPPENCRMGKGSFDLQAELLGKSQICRQDARNTLQRAVGVPPAEPSKAGIPGIEGASGLVSQICRRDAGNTFLLHGVTGSGKTEVYLQAIAHALEQGKGAIVLVPEISLTPQTVERFKARFSSGKLQTLVAVLHSHLSGGERHDEWHKIRQGRARIVIGARSAIFAPVEPLGLIIVDEEHEHTYKQEESPRYHARDVAVMRGQMESAVVVLGSATPSLESFYNCQKGKFALLELPERVDDQKMPRVRVVDMRQAAYKEKGPPIFTHQLKEAITQRLEKKEQTILFLNRRGYSSSLVCEKCGHVCECPNCSLALTYHRAQRGAGVSPGDQTIFSTGEKTVLPAGRRQHIEMPARLLCHICGYQEQVPAVCPNPSCKNPRIRYSGLGTQKVEDVLGRLFPHARIRRMDADVMKRKEDYRTVLDAFKHGDIDILIGTQMIAKGLHFPNVTLVGIIYADMALHQPDFRAGERTFQLLTQVAGRAGRGDIEGEVFVQAFTPFHPAIQYARRHDFNGFFEQELEFRKQLNYPPFSRVALLTLKGRNEDKVKFSAEHLRREIEKACSVRPAAEQSRAAGSTRQDPTISGPAPAPLLRAESLFRYQIMLRTHAMSRLSQTLAKITETLSLPDDVTLSVDIDPVSMS
jgi:primosomal protein N' (replication factor Y)